MSALEAAAGLREPIEHFDQLALLEHAALGDAASEPMRLCETARAQSLRLRLDEPERGQSRGALERMLGLGRGAELAHQERVDAWFDALDALEAETEAAVADWRAGVDQTVIAAATADRDAAIRALAERGLFAPELAETACAEPLGTLMVRSALAHD